MQSRLAVAAGDNRCRPVCEMYTAILTLLLATRCAAERMADSGVCAEVG